MLCICSVGVVAMDEGVYAVEDPDGSPHIDTDDGSDSGPGTSDNPIVLTSDELRCEITYLVDRYWPNPDGVFFIYFSFESGSEVMISPAPVGSDVVFQAIDEGSLDQDMVGVLSGTATDDFVINVFIPGYETIFYFIAVEPELGSEQNPYTGEATIPLVDGGEAWVEVGTYVQFDVGRNSYGFDGFQGSGLMNVGHALYGTVTTPGDYEIQYGSAGASDVPVYDYMFTLHVVGDVMLEFLSDPTDPLCATIAYSKP